jgi:hypothetical protein
MRVRPSLPDIGSATLPVSYERAKTALAQCNQIDECKDWSDKAAALASYAKQADDQTLHNFATRISARAIRRCGELLKTFQSTGGRPQKTTVGTHGSSQREAADKAGMSEHQELQAVRVANVPAHDFELAVESDDPPTITRLAELGTTARPSPPGFIHATHVIAELREFATFCHTHPAEVVADGICGHEVVKVLDHIETIGMWLSVFVAQLKRGGDRGVDEVSRQAAQAGNKPRARSSSGKR